MKPFYPYLDRRSAFDKQRGQALVIGIFILVATLAGLFFFFNAGKLYEEKSKLINTADAVAYSAGVMHARTLNFEAYTNRTMVANTLTYAQLVSLSSWSKYVLEQDEPSARSILARYEEFYPDIDTRSEAAGIIRSLGISKDSDGGILQTTADAIDTLIRDILMNAQQVAYEGLEPARALVMDKVAQTNYLRDGEVEVDPVPLSTQKFTDFVSRYDKDERTRFAEVVREAIKKEGFLDRRDWPSLGIIGSPVYTKSKFCKSFPGKDWLTRDGSTELVDYDTWHAFDVLREWMWIQIPKTGFCFPIIHTVARGEQHAAKQSAIADGSGNGWHYSGLPGFYDLSEDMLKQEDPKLEFSIRLLRRIGQTRTSEGRSAIRNTPRLNDYHAQPAGGDALVAVSTSEVYFERPPASLQKDGSNNGKDESDGGAVSINTWSEKKELGSLFNPFWRVRLIRSSRYVTEAQAMQGATLR